MVSGGDRGLLLSPAPSLSVTNPSPQEGEGRGCLSGHLQLGVFRSRAASEPQLSPGPSTKCSCDPSTQLSYLWSREGWQGGQGVGP